MIIAQRYDYNEETERDIRMVQKMLDGTFDPEKDLPRKWLPPPEQMKQYW